MDETSVGTIVGIKPPDTVIIEAKVDIHRFITRMYEKVHVVYQDSRLATGDQLRAIHATIYDIAEYAAGKAYKPEIYMEELAVLGLQYVYDMADRDEVRYFIKRRYTDLVKVPFFSLSPNSPDCISESMAHDFLGWLIDLCLEYYIPVSGKLLERAEDVSRYLYACLLNRVCAVCGKAHSDIHHVDHVGMGGNRNEIHNEGRLAESLCREHHMETDNIGQAAFDEKYHVYGIKLDEHLCEVLNLPF